MQHHSIIYQLEILYKMVFQINDFFILQCTFQTLLVHVEIPIEYMCEESLAYFLAR